MASKLSLFLAELKRRGCLRTAGLYAIAAWAVIEVSATVLPYLLLPDWLVTLIVVLALVGFPISVVLSWFFDVIPESMGTQPLDPQSGRPERETVQKNSTWRRMLPASLTSIALLLAGLGLFFFLFVPSVAESFQERDWLLVTAFENETGDSAFDGSIRTALTTSLRQSGFMNVVSMERTTDALRELGLVQLRGLSAEDQRRLAAALRARAILIGQIGLRPSGYGIVARILDAETGRPIIRPLSIEAPNRESVLVALDLLARGIREGLGEHPGDVEAASMEIPMITTGSLDALRDLTAAQEADTGEESIRLLQLAVEKDSAFAMAHAKLGMNYYIHNNRPDGDRHFNLALSLQERLTERERLYISALAQEFRGDYAGAIVSHRVYLRKYEDDAAVWFRLGFALFRDDRCAESIEAFAEYLRFEPDEGNAHVNVAICQERLGEIPLAIESFQRALELSTSLKTDWTVNHDYGALLMRAGRTDSARAHFGLMLEESRGKRARGHRSLGLLSMYEGKYREASEMLQEAAEYNRVTDATLSEVRDLAFLASAYHRLADSTSLRETLKMLWRLLHASYLEPYFLSVIGQRFAQVGMVERAREVLSLLQGRTNEGNLSDAAAENLLRGEILLAEGRLEEAVSALSLAVKQRRDALHLEPLARAYRTFGASSRATEFYLQAVEDRSSLGWEAQEPWISAHYGLAQLYEEGGDTEKAGQYYSFLSDLWAGSPDDFPLRREVEARIEALLASEAGE
jgi:tetratricopeptide (TPR) repeat protein